MWSLAVEVAFYAALPVLAYLLLVLLCRRRWRPSMVLAGLAVLGALSPLWLIVLHTTDWLPTGAGLWLPHYLVWFVGGMTLTVLSHIGFFRCYAVVAVPVAVVAYLVVSTPIGGRIDAPALDLVQDVAKVMLYATSPPSSSRHWRWATPACSPGC